MRTTCKRLQRAKNLAEGCRAQCSEQEVAPPHLGFRPIRGTDAHQKADAWAFSWHTLCVRIVPLTLIPHAHRHSRQRKAPSRLPPIDVNRLRREDKRAPWPAPSHRHMRRAQPLLPRFGRRRGRSYRSTAQSSTPRPVAAHRDRVDPATDRPGGGLSTDAAWQRGRRVVCRRVARRNPVVSKLKDLKDLTHEVGREEAAQSQRVAKHVSEEHSTRCPGAHAPYHRRGRR